MAGSLLGGDALTDVAHVIQTALTPVFLLSGIGTLLNVFSTRLARVADQYHRLTELLASNDDLAQTASLRRHIARVSRRRSALDTSVILGGMAGALTCGAAFALFLVTLRSAEDTEILLWLFGGALGCTMAALMAFLVDTALAWHGHAHGRPHAAPARPRRGRLAGQPMSRSPSPAGGRGPG